MAFLATHTLLALEAILLVASMIAGCIGALTGLGGGVIIVPLLVLGFGIDLRYAVGISLVCVIATSSGAAVAYVREGYTNIRIGMFLEIATTIGALTGAFIAAYVSKSLIGAIFAIMLLFSAYWSNSPKPADAGQVEPDWWARTFRMNGTYPDGAVLHSYNVTRVPAGFALMYVAGVLSALLGIGSGALKVVAMDTTMKIPFKVSTTTSNFMIGVTAAASVGVYLGRGYIDPTLAAPVMLGILTGSIIGARILHHIPTALLRKFFAVILCLVAVEMIFKSLTGEL